MSMPLAFPPTHQAPLALHTPFRRRPLTRRPPTCCCPPGPARCCAWLLPSWGWGGRQRRWRRAGGGTPARASTRGGAPSFPPCWTLPAWRRPQQATCVAMMAIRWRWVCVGGGRPGLRCCRCCRHAAAEPLPPPAPFAWCQVRSAGDEAWLGGPAPHVPELDGPLEGAEGGSQPVLSLLPGGGSVGSGTGTAALTAWGTPGGALARRRTSFRSLREAAAAARDGDRILLRRGVHNGMGCVGSVCACASGPQARKRRSAEAADLQAARR